MISTDRKLLILSTSAGSGHVTCGNAIARTASNDPRFHLVRHVDALEMSNRWFRDFYSRLYAELVRQAPGFLGWWYQKTDEPWKTDAVRLTLDRLNTRPLVRYLRLLAPDDCLCTHFMPAGIISHLIETGALQTRLSIVITDFDLHAMWLSRNYHRYYTAHEGVRQHLIRWGVDPDRITVTGIPVDSEFSATHSAIQARSALKLHPHRTTLLFSANQLSMEIVEGVLTELARINRPDIQVAVICGRHPTLRHHVEHHLTTLRSQVHFNVTGFTRRMPLWMTAADLFIGKPGGLSSSEAMASGLPMVILNPIPGQEERNSDWLLENGLAIKCNNLETLSFKIRTLLESPSRLRHMHQNALTHGRPGAARAVIESLLHEEFTSPGVNRPSPVRTPLLRRRFVFHKRSAKPS